MGCVRQSVCRWRSYPPPLHVVGHVGKDNNPVRGQAYRRNCATRMCECIKPSCTPNELGTGRSKGLPPLRHIASSMGTLVVQHDYKHENRHSPHTSC